jgi:hypothetical protein
MFSQCNVTLTGVAVTQSNEHYNYLSYLETLLTYSTNTADSHLTKTYWYLESGDMRPCGPLVEIHTATTNEGFIARWPRLTGNRDFQLFGLLHTDLCNVPFFLLPGLRLHIKLTKALPSYYRISETAESVYFQIL